MRRQILRRTRARPRRPDPDPERARRNQYSRGGEAHAFRRGARSARLRRCNGNKSSNRRASRAITRKWSSANRPTKSCRPAPMTRPQRPVPRLRQPRRRQQAAKARPRLRSSTRSAARSNRPSVRAAPFTIFSRPACSRARPARPAASSAGRSSAEFSGAFSAATAAKLQQVGTARCAVPPREGRFPNRPSDGGLEAAAP
jgi:hypothetical protein